MVNTLDLHRILLLILLNVEALMSDLIDSTFS